MEEKKNETALAAAKEQELALKKGKQDTVKSLLDKYKEVIQQTLPSTMTADRMTRIVINSINKSPDLLNCTTYSLISCVLTTSQLGLMPDPVLGESYLIPFKNKKKKITECTLIIGYKGLLALARRSGQVKSVEARAVRKPQTKIEFPTGVEGDYFSYEYGTNKHLRHRPGDLSLERDVTHFYALVEFVNGGKIFFVMSRAQVEAIRNESSNYKYADYKDSTVWGKYFEEMGCKTVLRRIMKYVPLSPEVQKAIDLDEQAERGEQNIQILDDFASPDDLKDAQDAEVVGDEEFTEEPAVVLGKDGKPAQDAAEQLLKDKK